MSKLRVVIADDQPMMRAGFRAVLEATGNIQVVAEAGTGQEAVEAANRHAPDVVLMDIRMPVMDGIEATRRLPRQRVLILTTFGLDEYIIDALRAGASGFLLKDAPTEEVVQAVRAVAAGDAVLAPAVTRQLLDQVGRRLPAAVSRAPDELAQLTEREQQVLRMLAAGLSNAEISHALVLSEATVKTHVSNLLGKLGLRDRVQAVIYAYETGLIAPGDGLNASSTGHRTAYSRAARAGPSKRHATPPTQPPLKQPKRLIAATTQVRPMLVTGAYGGTALPSNASVGRPGRYAPANGRGASLGTTSSVLTPATWPAGARRMR